MLLIRSGDKPRHTRPSAKGIAGGRYMSFFGIDRYKMEDGEVTPEDGVLYPHAYMVGQAFGNDNNAHYHIADQYQVLVQGGGTFSGHPVETTAIHYASAYTAYGPIVPDERGIEYLTLRNTYDDGAQYMTGPKASADVRAELRKHRGAHREREVPAFGPMPADQLAALTQISTREIIAHEADGLGAWLHEVPPGASVTGPDPAISGGQYWVVVAGGLDYGDEADRPFRTVVFLSSDETSFTAKAGAQGLQILTLQFPVLQPHSPNT